MPIRTDGPVTQGTRDNLITGLRGRAMTADAVDAIRGQAAGFATRLVDTYETSVAAGEVGSAGSGRTTDEPIIAGRPPTVLLYGRVQSGKTNAMLLTSALCLDNGFRVIVVLTANSVALVQQTAARFRALDGPRVFSSTGGDDDYEWVGREGAIASEIERDGMVLVCAKDAIHLPAAIRLLQQVDASSYPAIIFDDEADAATPDTTLAARSSGRANAPTMGSSTFRRVIENDSPNEQGISISEILPHSLYVQVTATPFVFFLQRRDARIRPTVPLLLEPGAGYCGGERFFGTFDPAVSPPVPPLVEVPSTEVNGFVRRQVPRGLAASIDFFLVAAAAASRRPEGWPAEGFKHLSHPNSATFTHTTAAGHINRHLDVLRASLGQSLDNAETLFADAHAELRRTLPDAPPLQDLAQRIFSSIRQKEVFTVNMTSAPVTYGPRVNFLVGGNILGRGLTIDELLVTYYVREAQTSQMDTVWQHARMYGYRDALMPYTRVYLPQRIAVVFKGIHESEEHLRRIILLNQQGQTVPVRIAARTRATRRNVTEPDILQVLPGGVSQWNPQRVHEDVAVAAEIRDELLRHGVPLTGEDRDRRTTSIPFDAFTGLIERVPVAPGDPGRWDADNILAVVDTYRDDYGDTAPVYVRQLVSIADRTRGRLGGEEIDQIRAAANGVPALALLHIGPHDSPRGWYPTLVLPDDAGSYIINPF